jgi:TfoX/Sxy family transcriptional regulator of competence genes
VTFDQVLAQRIGDRLAGVPGVTSKQMFGRFVFLIDGHLTVGVTGADLMVRVGRDDAEAVLARPGVRPSDMGGRRMAGWVVVDGSGLADDHALDGWIGQARTYVAKLAPK